MPTVYENPNRKFQEQGSSVFAQVSADAAKRISEITTGQQASPISASVISSPGSFALPNTPTPQSYDLSSLPTIGELLNSKPTDTEVEQDALGNDLLSATRKMGTKAAAQIEAENRAGLPEFNRQLTDVNAQIQTLQKEAAAAQIRSEDRLAPTFAIQGEQAQIERQRSVRALGLSAIAQTIQGNVALAQDQADRAIELEFAPVQAEIDYLEEALQLNEGKLTREEARRADALQVQLTERQRVLDEQKTEKQGINSVLMIAAQYQAPAAILNRILSAGSYAEAITLAGQYVTDPKAMYELESARLDNQLKLAQIADTKAQTAGRYSEMTTAGAPIPSISDNGKAAVGVKANVIDAITGLKLTEGQANAVSYSLRMIEANTNLNNRLGDGITSGDYNPTTLASSLGRVFKSDNARAVERDLENFIRAQLRKESGAQIADTEMEGGRKIYSPQGILTNKKDIAATKATREQAIQSMIAQSGPAGAYIKQYYDYMNTGGLTPEEQAIIHGGGPAMGGSTPAIISGDKFY